MSIISSILECFATGLFTALILLLFSKLGWLPLVMFMYRDIDEE